MQPPPVTAATPGWVLVAVLAIGLLVALVVLLSNPVTRAATLVVFGIALVALPLLAVVLFGVRHESRQSRSMAEAEAERAMIETLRSSRPTVARAEAEQPATTPLPVAPADPPAKSKPAVWRAIVRALNEAVQQDKTRPAKPAAVNRPEAELATRTAEQEVPPRRPPWVVAPTMRNSSGVYCSSTSVGPSMTPAQRDADMPEAIQGVLGEYVERELGKEAAVAVRLPPDVLQGLVKETWDEPVPPLGWEVPVRHLRLEIDGQVQQQIQEGWRGIIVTGRLWQAGIGLGGVLAVLAVVYGYLSIDQATRGSYRGRLGLAAMLLVVVVIGVAVMVS